MKRILIVLFLSLALIGATPEPAYGAGFAAAVLG